AADAGELGQGVRAVDGDLAQGGVREHHVGGHVALLGGGEAPAAQAVEQGRGDAGGDVGRGSAAALGAAAAALALEAQVELGLAAQQRAGGVGEAQRVVALVVHGDVFARHQLAEDGAPALLVELAADAAGGDVLVV